MKKRLLFIAILAAVGAGIASFYNSSTGETGPGLQTAAVTRGDVVETVEATGTLEAVTTVQVGTQVSGTIKALHADFNSSVRRGQVIAELEPSLFETQVEQASATVIRLQADVDRVRVTLEDAELKLKRARDLSAKQLIPATDLEAAETAARQAAASLKAAEAQVVQARASLNQNEVNLGHTIIRAPIDGIVISRNVDVGQTVAASMQAPTLFVLARDLAEMRVNASISESDIGRIASGQHVTFRVDAYPDDTFTGTVSQVRLSPVVEQNVVSYVTVIDVPNPGLKLKPGMTASVTVEVAREDDVLRVPNAAFRFRPTEEVFAALGQELPGEATPVVAGSEAGADGAGAAAATGERAAPGAGAGVGMPAGARGPFAAMSDEERAAMRERVATMSDEERAAMRQRFQQMATERGVRPPGGVPGDGAGGAVGPSMNGAAAPAGPAGAGPGGRARVWVLENGRLQPVPVRAGLTDGIVTAVLGGPLGEGAQVVTGIVAQAATTTGATSSPLLPRFGRPPGGGGGQAGGQGGGQAAGQGAAPGGAR
jgi:HlyD family secretion protein